MVLLTSQYTKLKKGDAAPDFDLGGIDGKRHSLGSFSGKKAFLVIFMCNHCPYVKPKMEYIAKLQDVYGPQGLQIVGINSNDPTNYPEDGPEGMKRVATAKKFHFPYLVDKTQETARAYGAVCTPDPYLLDGGSKLVYHGRLDDAHGEPHENGKTQEIEDALKQLLAGKTVTVETRPSMGCSIKWKAENGL
ncbi:MAG TPA: thioredoxin family protein [Candidatus Bilamarchaeaceae archaeon]|nr:thioredoxin family protein [Candidatus Bilamarchaeaceae archaeon]